MSFYLSEVSAQSKNSFFKNTYAESRQTFLENAKALAGTFPEAELRSLPVVSTAGSELFIDSFYIPPASGKKQRLLILTSGIHGIEGFVGSALQNTFLQENFFGQRDPDLGLLIVHALNPFGFQYERRVTENNVDLNRNLDVGKDLFQQKNEGYQKVNDLLNPSTTAASGLWDRLQFYFHAGMAILEHSMDSLRRAVLRGQYEFPQGIYYGGQDFESQKTTIEKEFLNRADGYEKILLIDLHTGYGQRGKLHLFADRSPFIKSAEVQKVFKGYTLDEGQKKDFYEVTGGLVVYAAKLFQQKSNYVGMVFEFGTLDSQKTLGSLDSIYRMTKENQLAHHNAASKEDEQEIRHLFREMFYPSSPEWQTAVTDQFRKTLSDALKNQRQ